MIKIDLSKEIFLGTFSFVNYNKDYLFKKQIELTNNGKDVEHRKTDDCIKMR